MAHDFLLDAPGGRFPATRRSAVCAVASDDPAERARAFEIRWFASFDPARARFRTYLKTCLDHFAMEQARNERRQKRGGDAIRIDLDFEAAEAELAGAAS